MKSIFWAFIFSTLYCSFSATAGSLPQTSVTFNAAKSRVHVAAWLSPSCTHCKDYFLEEFPKIISLPGFCVELHFLPHLYLLDMPVAVLIWSQGPQKAYENAKFFYEMQGEWLNLSASRDSLDDSRRIDDLNIYLNEVKTRIPNDYESIRNYLKANDPYLYVKMVALKRFRIEHLVQYLPNGIQMVDLNLSLSLMNNLPVKDGKVVNFSPAFTSASGQILPDDILHKGILTAEVAENMLSKAGPFTPEQIQTASPEKDTRPQSAKSKPPSNALKQKSLSSALPSNADSFEDAEGVQHVIDEQQDENIQHAPDNEELNKDDEEIEDTIEEEGTEEEETIEEQEEENDETQELPPKKSKSSPVPKNRRKRQRSVSDYDKILDNVTKKSRR